MFSPPPSSSSFAEARAELALGLTRPRGNSFVRSFDSLFPSFRRSVAAWGAVFTCSNACIGAGVLAFPNVFANGGLVLTLSLMLIVAVLEKQSLSVLVRESKILGVTDYQGIVGKLYGSGLSIFFSCIIVLYVLLLHTHTHTHTHTLSRSLSFSMSDVRDQEERERSDQMIEQKLNKLLFSPFHVCFVCV